MASYYVDSNAGGAGTGADWANAFTTLSAAFSGKSAGDIFYVAHNHAQTQASALTLTAPGTPANPSKVICVTSAGSVPPVAADLRTTATVSTTGANSMEFAGTGVVYEGIIFQAGSGASAGSITLVTATSSYRKFKNCGLVLNNTSGSSTITMATAHSGTYIELDNTYMSFGATGQQVSLSFGRFTWKNTPSALQGSAVPTTLITYTSGVPSIIELRGVDLSAAGSGKTLFTNSGSTAVPEIKLLDCKLNASVTIQGAPGGPGAHQLDTWRAGASGVNYNVFSNRYQGTLVEELTIVRTGGASDGTTPLAWKIVTTANSHWESPFESPPIVLWNDTTGSSVTATVQGIWGGGAVPNDDEIWLEVEYLGDASSPKGSFVNDSKATSLTTAAGQTAGSGTWGGSTTKFALGVSFTPQQKGWILARVKAAKASSTFYVDPKVTLS